MGREGAGCIKNQMAECAAFAGASREAGTSDNLENLADWAISWRCKVYRKGSLTEATGGSGQEEALVEKGKARPSTAEKGPGFSTKRRQVDTKMQLWSGCTTAVQQGSVPRKLVVSLCSSD
jgi:hypothetical protein